MDQSKRRDEDQDSMFFDVLFFQQIKDLYTNDTESVLSSVNQVIHTHSHEIADVFYTELLSLPAAVPFLNNDLVEKRLRASLSNWILELFAERSKEEWQSFFQHQMGVGNVHARINVPMILVHYGLSIVKRECIRIWNQGAPDADKVAAGLELIGRRIDLAGVFINQSYLQDVLTNEREAQSMRMISTRQNVAVECERVKSSLFDWLRSFLTVLYSCDERDIRHFTSIEKSDFGLWVIYKADILFSDQKQLLDNLKAQIRLISKAAAEASRSCISEEQGGFGVLVKELNESVSHASWLLSSFVNHALEMEGGRDPLTHLLNRRFIPAVLQRAVKASIEQGMVFSLLMLDIDRFKNVNDTHGHDAGDRVLSQFAELLTGELRSGDFIFRYGGEEFLVLLAGAEQTAAGQVAEKLRLKVESTKFLMDNGQTLHITTSIGASVHHGHPDYSLSLKNADEALYKAKSTGRNKVVFQS